MISAALTGVDRQVLPEKSHSETIIVIIIVPFDHKLRSKLQLFIFLPPPSSFDDGENKDRDKLLSTTSSSFVFIRSFVFRDKLRSRSSTFSQESFLFKVFILNDPSWAIDVWIREQIALSWSLFVAIGDCQCRWFVKFFWSFSRNLQENCLKSEAALDTLLSKDVDSYSPFLAHLLWGLYTGLAWLPQIESLYLHHYS